MENLWKSTVKNKAMHVRILCTAACMCLFLFLSMNVRAQGAEAVFASEYAKPGQDLEVQLNGVDLDGCQCAYEWTVDGEKREATGSVYQVTEADLEKFIQVTVEVTGQREGTYTAKMYCSELPVMYITTEAQIQNKEDYVDGTMSVQRNDAYQDATVYDGDIEIRYRGNTTMGYPKKPYKVKLGEKTDMFGFGKNKHWTLLANYLDGSFMRNSLSYNLSGALGMPYMQSVNVILILNGQYQGLYQFCEQIRVDYDSDGNRVDIYDWESAAEDFAEIIAEANGFSKDDAKDLEEAMLEDLSWAETGVFAYKGVDYQLADYEEIQVPPLTGGYLLELDSYYDEISKFTTEQLGQPINMKSPETANSSQELMDYAKKYLDAFETAIQSYDLTASLDGIKLSYAQLFDMDSLADYFLVNELFMNEDAMKKSTYMYKDIDGPFFMGPIWDMDWSSDSGVGGSNRPDQWQTLYFNDGAQSRQWYKFIIREPYFAQKVRDRYLEIRNTLLEEMVKDGGTIDARAAELETAAGADFAYWGLFGGDYDGQVNRLKSFLKRRLEWMDEQFSSLESLRTSWQQDALAKTEASCELSEEEVAKISVTAPEGAVRAALLVNGIYMGEASVTGDEAVIMADRESLIEQGRGKRRMATWCFEMADDSAVYGYGELVPDALPQSRIIQVSAAENGSAGIVQGEEWLDQAYAFDQEELTVQAKAREGYRFAGWYAKNQLVSQEETYRFAVDGDLSLEARFEQMPETCHIQVSATEGGTAAILLENEPVVYVEAEIGSHLTILAAESAGYAFDGWYIEGKKAYSEKQIDLTVQTDLSLEARFVKNSVQEPGGEGEQPQYTEPQNTESSKATETPQKSTEAQTRSMTQVSVRPISDKVYNGKAKKPKTYLTYGGETLKFGTDYTVTYKNNKNTGKAKVVLTGKGNYQGTRTVFFRIVPKKTAKVKAVSAGKRAVKVTWKKDNKATGYQIQYSTQKAFKKAVRKVTVKKNRVTAKTLKGLKNGRTYYVRIQSYRVIDGRKAYGPYSKGVKVRTGNKA